MSRLHDSSTLTILGEGKGKRIYSPSSSERILFGDTLQLEMAWKNLVAMARDLGLKIVPRKSTTALLLEPGKAENVDAVITTDSPISSL